MRKQEMVPIRKRIQDQSVKPSQAEPTVPGASGAEAQTEVKV